MNIQIQNQDTKIKKIQTEQEGLVYSIQEEEMTASVIGIKPDIIEEIIPHSIIYKSKSYIITSISEKAFNSSRVKSIQFAPDSELQTIEKKAFFKTQIENFTIPPHLTKIDESVFFFCQNLRTIEIPLDSELRTIESDAFFGTQIEKFTIPTNLIELKEGCFLGMKKLKQLIVSPDNPRYSLYDEKFLICKTTEKSDIQDFLVFCVPNFEEVTIPSFIKNIGPYAFYEMKNLKRVEIQADSELQTVGSQSFARSLIESFTISHHITKIDNYAFQCCKKLKKLKFLQIPNFRSLKRRLSIEL